MPGKEYPTHSSRTRRTSLQRAANRRGLLNLTPAIEAELARLNNVRRLFNMGQRNPRIVEEEGRVYQKAMALVRELEEDAQRDEAERLRLIGVYRAAVVAAATSAREAAEARRLASSVLQAQAGPVQAAGPVPAAAPQARRLAAPMALNLSGGPYSGVPYPGNLPLSNSPLIPYTPRRGGRKTRKVKNTKKSRKHLRR